MHTKMGVELSVELNRVPRTMNGESWKEKNELNGRKLRRERAGRTGTTSASLVGDARGGGIGSGGGGDG